jgi:hypothetical protein
MMTGDTGEIDTSLFVRQAVCLMIEEASEAEVSERLARGYYERGSQTAEDEVPREYRNGVRLGRLKTAEGVIEYGVPSTDGAPGLIRAVEECLPRALRQRCLAHKMRNLKTKVPAERWREVKAMALAAYHASSPKTAQLAADLAACLALCDQWGKAGHVVRYGHHDLVGKARVIRTFEHVASRSHHVTAGGTRTSDPTGHHVPGIFTNRDTFQSRFSSHSRLLCRWPLGDVACKPRSVSAQAVGRHLLIDSPPQ